MEQRVFFAWVDRHSILARHRRIHEFQQDFVSYTFNVPVSPDFEWECAGRTASLFDGSVVGTAGGMRFNFVRLAIHDVDAATIGLPTGYARSKVLVGVCDALVVRVAEFVIDGVGCGISA